MIITLTCILELRNTCNVPCTEKKHIFRCQLSRYWMFCSWGCDQHHWWVVSLLLFTQYVSTRTPVIMKKKKSQRHVTWLQYRNKKRGFLSCAMLSSCIELSSYTEDLISCKVFGTVWHNWKPSKEQCSGILSICITDICTIPYTPVQTPRLFDW